MALHLGSVQQVSAQFASRPQAARNRVSSKTVAVARPQAPRNTQESGAQRALLLAATALIPASPALAADGDVVDSAVNSLIDVLKAAGGAVKTGLEAASVGAQYAKETYDKVAPVVKLATDVAAPYVESGIRAASDIAAPAFRAVEPAVKGGVQSTVSEAEKLLAAQGVDTKVVVDTTARTTETVVSTTKPALQQALSAIMSTEPVLLGEYALGLIALYYLGPPFLKLAFGSLRGYAGDVTAPSALDMVTTGDAYILDIRSQREKEQTGVPELPNSGRLVELEYAQIEDRKVRNQLRNASTIELEVTAIQIAALKKLKRSTTVLLLDRNGSTSKAVAKELAKRGFNRVYVISNGFQGWTASKLKTRFSSTLTSFEVLPPVFGTVASTVRGGTVRNGNRPSVANRKTVSGNAKALPSGR